MPSVFSATDQTINTSKLLSLEHIVRMTSQKRYRHHQDSHNGNGARLRDIPPRFKRQKSSSSPARPSSPLEAPENGADNETTATRKSDVVAVATSVAAVTTSQYSLEGKLAGQMRSTADALQASQPYVLTSAWKWPERTENVFTLQPWDSRPPNGMVSSQSPIVSLGTNFGFRPNSPPLSPWTPGAAAAFPRPHGMMGSPTWAPNAGVPFTSPVLHGSPAYAASEPQTAGQILIPQNNQSVFWGVPQSPSRYQASPSPPIPRSTPPPTVKTTENVKNNTEVTGSNEKRMVDYSDPDIRTIEMLRELERVADQKENENDFGVDRKSLVSHHLRMLMCAMDRYTEGIEDDLVESARRDEVSPLSDSRGSTPGISQDASHNRSLDETAETKENKMVPITLPKSQRIEMSPVQKILPSFTNSFEVARQSCVPSFHPSLQPVSKLDEQKNVDSHENGSWDLWSSPTFDFCGLLLNHGSEDFDLFSGSRIKSEKERKPLYQRQARNF